ncbi:hypothetical protein [Salinarimonas soli]|uniref:Uncharacterized protein n=1 Tax=Salinarimonas soli TaxID=1638099 RepID=A0A5B2VD13_9HYPH|nr:hypothetical protein [Salinarimonas soli]KAA2236951.1 hypothetical protein F0L46_11810 [Salinarimonas soli]
MSEAVPLPVAEVITTAGLALAEAARLRCIGRIALRSAGITDADIIKTISGEELAACRQAFDEIQADVLARLARLPAEPAASSGTTPEEPHNG